MKLRSPLFSSAALALLTTLAGCMGDARVVERDSTILSRAGPPRTIRTDEELREVRQRLALRHDPHFDSYYLEVVENDTAPASAPLTISVSAAEALRLRSLDAERDHAIRFWYHERQIIADRRVGYAELASIGEAGSPVVDRGRCSLHGKPMERRRVPIHYGLPISEFLQAYETFPHAAFVLGGCVIMDDSPTTEPAYVCAGCDAAYQAWTPLRPASPPAPPAPLL